MFRMGDAQDAEEATRIAMAVYSTMIRDDPDSRARLRVTPEQAPNFPSYYCLASWIANGTRKPSFMGETYPLPELGDAWANHHLAAQSERVGPYPEQLKSTLDAQPTVGLGGNGCGAAATRPATTSEREYIVVPYEEKNDAKRLGARWDADAESWLVPAGEHPEPFARWRDSNRSRAPGTDTSATGNGPGPGHPKDAQANEAGQRNMTPEHAQPSPGTKREVPTCPSCRPEARTRPGGTGCASPAATRRAVGGSSS